MRKVIIELILLCFLILLGCDGDKSMTPPPEPRPEGWISLGLEDKQINSLVIAGDWLYACATQDGLFRIKHPAASSDQWQFLGLGDLDVVQPGLAGVMDVVVNDDTIVVGVWSRGTATPGIFRSVDDGKSWSPSVKGFRIPQDISGTGVVLALAQSPIDSRMLLAGTIIGINVYISKDLGKSWIPLFDFERGETSFFTLCFHPNIASEIWAGGQIPNSGFPFLFRSTDLGMTWKSVYEPPFNPFESSDSINDLAFNPEDEATAYVCLDRIIIKTTDSGEKWFTSLDTLETGVFWNVSSNPFGSNELIACSSDSLYRTTDAGKNWSVFAMTPDNTGFMKSLIVDWENRILYVNVFNPQRGVFQLYFN